MIKLILFDLGGVIVRIPEEKYFKYLSKINRASSFLAETIINRSVGPLESGRMSLSKFQAEMSREFGVPSNRIGWLSFFKKHAELDKNMINLVKGLKSNYRVAFLSNVDKWRYDYMMEHILDRVAYLFDYKFASFKLHTAKPSPLIYEKVLGAVRLKPYEVLFIDNNLENVIGARSVGMPALQFSNIKNLRLDLKRFGIKLKAV